MAIEADEFPTLDEIYDHMRNVRTEYQRCKGGDHNWQMTNAQGYTKTGQRFRGSDLRTAAWFECTDTCLVNADGVQGCGRQRDYQMEWNSRIQDLFRTTDYTYSNMHPDLASPKGISTTGINARSIMPNFVRSEQIRRRMFQIAKPTPVQGAA